MIRFILIGLDSVDAHQCARPTRIAVELVGVRNSMTETESEREPGPVDRNGRCPRGGIRAYDGPGWGTGSTIQSRGESNASSASFQCMNATGGLCSWDVHEHGLHAASIIVAPGP